MIQIKKFIDKIAYLDSRNSKDVVLNIQDARGLRDEISKLLLDLKEFENKSSNRDVTKIEIKGGTFK
ncbi:hypothetical protein EBU91_00080 [bacterium]|nr:hypothetical protein [bacterium]